MRFTSPPRERSGGNEQALGQLCENPEKGITAWPIASIEQAVQPTSEQRALLDELKSAAAKAADAFKGSCGGSYAMTPPGRLRAMTNRISATPETVRIVRSHWRSSTIRSATSSRHVCARPQCWRPFATAAATGGERAA